MLQWTSSVGSLGVGLALACGAATVSGCANAPGGSFDLTSGFLGQSTAEPGKAKSLSELKQAHLEAPGDASATVAYARGLKSVGRSKDALALVEGAAGSQPDNQKLVVEQGLLALELGQTAKAQHALLRASPDTKDWTVLSGLGVAHAGVGQHTKAQGYFQRALEISPGNPTVLNNLALSYILDKKVEKGRDLLQQASATGGDKPQIAHNLELALALHSGGQASDKPSSKKGPGAKVPSTAAASPAMASVGAERTPALAPSVNANRIAKSTDPAIAGPPATTTSIANAAASGTSNAAPIPTAEPLAAVEARAPVEKASLEPVLPQILNFGGPLAHR